MVVKYAEENGIYLQMALTNNWNPESSPSVEGSGATALPRNTLSNDYGR